MLHILLEFKMKQERIAKREKLRFSVPIISIPSQEIYIKEYLELIFLSPTFIRQTNCSKCINMEENISNLCFCIFFQTENVSSHLKHDSLYSRFKSIWKKIK